MVKLAFALVLSVSLLSYSSSASVAFLKQKFETWFGTYAQHFEESSSITCNSTLQQYKNPYPGSPPTRLAIAYHADCILSNTTETIKANMASAGVILGLMPSLLSFLGPTLAESSTLGLERPFLSLLLIIGAPAFYPFRPFNRQKPLEAFKQPFRLLPQMPWFCFAQFMVSILQYLLALAAAINVITASIQLGLKTVMTSHKDQSFLPLIWVILSIIIHLCAMVKQHLFSTKQKKGPKPNGCAQTRPFTLFIAETQLCATRERSELLCNDETFLTSVVSAVLQVQVMVHLFLGTIFFSSLLFIGAYDTWTIVLRYALSAVVAQLIRMFEIAGLHGDYNMTNRS